MSTAFELTAEIRHAKGKGASRRLRRLDNQIPAVMYGGGEAAVSLTFSHKHVHKALESEAFYSHILTIHLNGEKHQAVLKALQRHPYKPRILHMDLLRITGKEKIHMSVPLHFKGEDIAPGVKLGKGIVSHLLASVEVRCLPAHLPEYISVDLSNMELDEAINLSDLVLPPNTELSELAHGNDLPVAVIHLPRAAMEESATPAAVEVPATAQQTPAKAAAPAAGAGKTKEKGKDKG